MTYIKKLKLQNFRSFDYETVNFNKGLNIIVGLNGSGKTNVIEAIYYLALKQSFKVSNTKQMIKSAKNNFKIHADLINNRHKITQKCDSISKSNEKSAFTVILFSPESTNMINSNPNIRRNYIDSIIMQYDTKYRKILQNYNHITKQRASLICELKNLSHSEQNSAFETLKIWNERYASHSVYITDSRYRLIEKINQRISIIYSEIVNFLEKTCEKQFVEIELETTSDFNDSLKLEDRSKELLNAINANFEKEKILGWTSLGAKSDDLIFKLNGKLVKGNSSFGEQWSIMISFVLALWQILKESEKAFTNIEPILLLDDIFTGLDQLRREEIIHLIKNVNQCIITCADEKDIPNEVNVKYHRIDFRYDGRAKVKEALKNE